jgi:hypothetical protein
MESSNEMNQHISNAARPSSIGRLDICEFARVRGTEAANELC